MKRLKFWYLSTGLSLMLACLPFSLASDNSGRSLPRYASIRAKEMNLRRGPGTQYPVDWVYTRAGLPVQIIAEYGTWRKIRDSEGTEGWVRLALLSGKRQFVIVVPRARIYKKPELKDARVLAIAERNVTGKLLECKPSACKVVIDQFKGWINRHDIWGVMPDEEKLK